MPPFTEPIPPTPLWRLRRGTSTAHATIFSNPDASSPDQATVTWFFDGTMDRIENYQTMELAMARADDIRGVLLRDGWVEDTEG